MWEEAFMWDLIKEYEEQHASEIFIDALLKYKHLQKIFITIYKNKYESRQK